MTTTLFDIAADLDTPVSAYLKLKPFRPRFLLESVEGGERLARYSFIGFGDCLEYRLDAAGLVVDGERRARPRRPGRSCSRRCADALARAPRPTSRTNGFPLHGGLVGVSSYDLVRYFERLPSHGARGRRRARRALRRAAIAAGVRSPHASRRAAARRHRAGAQRAAPRSDPRLARRLAGAGVAAEIQPARGQPVARTSSCTTSRAPRSTSRRATSTSSCCRCGSRGRCDLDPFEAYRALRLLNPSPYMYYCELGERVVVGSSPEALVKLNGGTAQMRPIAGTRPRGADAAQDAALEAELLADPKENAEHVMLVDLARNDLGRVARPGTRARRSVSLDRALQPRDAHRERRQRRARAGQGRVRPVRRRVSGRHAGRRAEGARDGDHRRARAGAARVLRRHGRLLRPRRRHGPGDRDPHAWSSTATRYSFQAGAGIVADSVPASEYHEVFAKSAVLRRALELAKEGL